MTWLTDLFTADSPANAVLIIGIVSACGLALGSLRVWGISLGIGGVLFSGLIFNHFGLKINEHMLHFAREFGLILFVYTIGMQVGPGFLASLRRQGLPLNIMAATVVLLGTGISAAFVLMHWAPMPVAVGMLAGATTNTPALAAAQQALKDAGGAAAEAANVPALSYAIAYPFGVVGTILMMVLIRIVFRIDPHKEAAKFIELNHEATPRPVAVNLEVKNPNLNNIRLDQIPMPGDSGVVISRVLHGSRVEVAQPDTVVHLGDIMLAVGPRPALDQLLLIVGQESQVDLRKIESHISTRRIIVTKKGALGKTIDEIESVRQFDVAITRVSRSEIEFTPREDFKLQFGDTLLAVGEEESLNKVAAELGNSEKALNLPDMIPVLIGIALGVLVGSWPIQLPGMPAPVKLGLAGGPLIVALLLSRIGNIGPLVWYLPSSANLMLRELGIVLFLACVGIAHGEQFFRTIVHGPGLAWLGYSALITAIPLLLVAFTVRIVYKINYASLCGLIAGSMTDPPALAFAGKTTHSDAPYISYATVYPLVMLMRVLCAQALVMLLP